MAEVADPVEPLLAAAVAGIGGTERPGQREMAAAVADAVRTGQHLLVQAGTGTGKSLGYLVPVLAHAVRTERPVVVSTATLALQAQIVDRDLPRVADALAPLLGRRPTWQLVKGRSNYLCRHRLEGGLPSEEPALFDVAVPAGQSGADAPAAPPRPTSKLGREVRRLQEWAATTRSGDRDELVPGVSERAWRQVAVSAHDCLGAQRCPVVDRCFSETARERARAVDVVVSNHAFVAIDAFEGRQMLPEHDVLVVDEAHELADRVTSVISDELAGGTVEAAVRRAARVAKQDVSRLQTAAGDLDAALADCTEGRMARGLPEVLQLVTASVRDAARQVVGTLGRDGERGAPPDGVRHLARSAVSELFEVADRLAGGAGQPGSPDVVWVSRARRADGPGLPTLHVAPLSVAGLLRERLFAERTVVMTSATLALGGRFDAAAAATGLAGEQAPQWRGIDVGSPFDYRKQAMLYVARRLPPPGRDGTAPGALDELAALVEAAGGRTLGLFSSRRGAEAAAEQLRERLDLPVLCQGDDTTPTLVRAFARDPRTCLFGTLSLWQGVDVPGSSCQLVVIDRIPFPRPDDPLSSARQQAVAEAGGNGFMAVAAVHAALRLAQGAGRLVRTDADRGVVAVLDSRLATARYAAFLRSSLPPFWPTTDREQVLAALRRIAAQAPPPLAVAEPAARAV